MPDASTRSLLLRAALLLTAATTARVAAILLEGKPLAGELAAVLAVDWLAARAGAPWHSDSPIKPSLRGWAVGAGIGAGAVGVFTLGALITGTGTLIPRSFS